jgi:uncharacterized protein (TIGR02452 family)
LSSEKKETTEKKFMSTAAAASVAQDVPPSKQQQLSLNDFMCDPNSKRKRTGNGNTHPQYLEPKQSKQYRVDVWSDTRQCVEQGYYESHTGTKVSLPPVDTNVVVVDNIRSIQEQQKMFPIQRPQPSSVRKGPLKITLYRGDCLDAARICYVKYNGAPPLVMNAASHRHAGGGTANGSRAQEEEMCRRSNHLFQIDSGLKMQRKNFYPLKNGTGLFAPNTAIFRAGVNDYYGFLPQPFRVHFGVVAAPNQPALTPDGKSMLQEGVTAMTNSIQVFLRMGILAGCKTLIPISLGCGAFRCPPYGTAKILCQLIQQELSDPNCGVEEVVIAIFDDHNALRKGNDEGNFAPFAKTALSYFGPGNVTVVDESGEDLKPQFLSESEMKALRDSQASSSVAQSSKATQQVQQQQQKQQQQQQKKNNDDDADEVKYDLV